MAFLGSLGKWLGKAGLMASVPLTGGATAPFVGPGMSIIDTIGSGAGRAAQSMASNRGTKAELMMDAQSQLERELMAREQEKREAQGNAYRNAMRSSMAMNWKPASRPSGIPMVSFGAGPGEQGMGAARMLHGQSMSRLNAPDLQQGQSGMPAYNNLMQNKEFRGTMKPGFWEKLAGIGAFAAPIASQVFRPRSGGGVAPDGGAYGT